MKRFVIPGIFIGFLLVFGLEALRLALESPASETNKSATIERSKENMRSKSSHVWYSKKQFDMMQRNRDRFNQAILEDGSIVLYTEMTSTKKLTGLWDDYQYLGKGRWHKVLSN